MIDYKVPDWYKNAKFGIFMHWGVYTVPAYGGEWYPHWIYSTPYNRKNNNPENHFVDHHLETYGELTEFGYKDFVPMFKAENFDPAHWAELFKKAGAKFVMPVAEHHDGFAMYDTELSPWNAAQMGPCKDILAELKPEVEKQGMEFTISSHRVEHYWFMGGGRNKECDFPEEIPYGDMYWPSISLTFDERWDLDLPIDEKFMQDWLVRTCEIIDKYRPKIIYFDWWIEMRELNPYLKKFAAYYYNRAKEWGIEVAVNYKTNAFATSTAVLDLERKQMSSIYPYYWQCDTSLYRNNWCYTTTAVRKEAQEIVYDLVDIVSKNGALLLNIGPKSDGTFDPVDEQLLLDIGKWMDVNGEGIYDTRPWSCFGEGPTQIVMGDHSDREAKVFTSEDFRITYKNNTIYVFALKASDDGVYKVNCLGSRMEGTGFRAKILNTEVLGYCDCEINHTEDFLEIKTKDIIDTKYPICIKLTLL